MYFSVNRLKCSDRIQLKTIVTHVIRVLKIYQECDQIQHTIEIVQRACHRVLTRKNMRNLNCSQCDSTVSRVRSKLVTDFFAWEKNGDEKQLNPIFRETIVVDDAVHLNIFHDACGTILF